MLPQMVLFCSFFMATTPLFMCTILSLSISFYSLQKNVYMLYMEKFSNYVEFSSFLQEMYVLNTFLNTRRTVPVVSFL